MFYSFLYRGEGRWRWQDGQALNLPGLTWDSNRYGAKEGLPEPFISPDEPVLRTVVNPGGSRKLIQDQYLQAD